ncbi:MAG: hypothetical protein AAGB22_06955, partial [Bacteroidota bacterium]
MRSPFLRLLLGGWFVCCLTASGQAPIPYLLTEQDFSLLDSDRHEEAFDIETDQNGFVYFVNTAGVHRFNGKRMTKLKLPKSIPSSSFIGMFKDARGRIWVRSYEHGIGRIEGDSVVAYRHAHLIKRWNGAKLESLYMDDEGTLHLAPAGAGYLTISADGQKTEIWGRSSDMHGTFVTHLKDGTPFHFTIQKKARI